jgi:hypothetical protein
VLGRRRVRVTRIADLDAQLAVVREDEVPGEIGIRRFGEQAVQRAVDQQERDELVPEGGSPGELELAAVASRFGPRTAGGDRVLLLVGREGAQRVLPDLVCLAGVVQVTRDDGALCGTRRKTGRKDFDQGGCLVAHLRAVLIQGHRLSLFRIR